jgi:hypothetical protein
MERNHDMSILFVLYTSITKSKLKENQLVHEKHLLWKENLHDMVPYSYTSFEIPIQVGKRLHIRTDLRSFIAGKFGHSKSLK